MIEIGDIISLLYFGLKSMIISNHVDQRYKMSLANKFLNPEQIS